VQYFKDSVPPTRSRIVVIDVAIGPLEDPVRA